MKFQTCTFQTDFSDWWWRYLFWNCPNMNVTGLHWWSVNIGSGNGLVPSGTKPGLHWWSVNIGSGNGLVPSGTKPGLHWWSVNIGSGNGLVPSGTKPGLHWWSVNIGSGNGLVPITCASVDPDLSPYGVTRPQWVKLYLPDCNEIYPLHCVVNISGKFIYEHSKSCNTYNGWLYYLDPFI